MSPQKILLLDKQYAAISLVNWKRALKLLLNGKAEPIGQTNLKVVGKCVIPCVIRLLNSIPFNAYFGKVRFNRTNVLLRDQFKCQYCNVLMAKSSATIDHIIPVSRGGRTDYDNCVACCKTCNNTKGGKLPREAGMYPLKTPKQPTYISLYQESLKNGPDEWRDYIKI